MTWVILSYLLHPGLPGSSGYKVVKLKQQLPSSKITSCISLKSQIENLAHHSGILGEAEITDLVYVVYIGLYKMYHYY